METIRFFKTAPPLQTEFTSIGTAFLASHIPPFLLLPKALSSYGCSVSSSHQPAGKKLISSHTFPPSRSTVVSMLFWKAKDVAARETDRGMRFSGDPPHGELGRNHQKWATACKNPIKQHNCQEAHALKRGRTVKKKKMKMTVSSTFLECCGSIPYLIRFISKEQISVWESCLCYYPRNTCEAKGTLLDSFIRSAGDHTTRQESSQMPTL